MILLKSEQIRFTSRRSHLRTTIDISYKNIFINSQNSKEMSVDLPPSSKQFLCKFVTVRRHKILCSHLESNISDCGLLVTYSHETCFCRFFQSKDICFSFRERFGVHDVDFNDPSRPRTPKESAKVLTEIFNTRKIPDRFLD
jgi:hypothetical protein